MKKIFSAVALVMVGFQAQALEVTVSGQARSYELSASVEAMAKHEFLIWDKRTEDAAWKMGFVQPKVTIGSQGLMEAGLAVAPVGFLELGYTHSVTHRFYYKVKPFGECEDEICKGAVKREELYAKLALAYREWVLMPSYHQVRSRHGDNSMPMADEGENILAARGGDTLDAYSVLLGKQNGPVLLGLYARQAKFRDSEKKNEAQYLLGRLKVEEKTYGIGVGRYASDYSKPGLSVYASMAWTWGQSLALF